VLSLLAADPAAWHYGYDIARQTGLRSGTLYPVLARLAERGYLGAMWEPEPPEGRPRRHLYRITSSGAAHLARVAAAGVSPATPATRAALGGAS
jgi:DNA-binding PadR family transcriptional regulator